eukprot:354903-Chlamydomonas_euryale.AAC.4
MTGFHRRRPGGASDQVQIHIGNDFDFDKEVDGLRAHVGKIKQASMQAKACRWGAVVRASVRATMRACMLAGCRHVVVCMHDHACMLGCSQAGRKTPKHTYTHVHAACSWVGCLAAQISMAIDEERKQQGEIIDQLVSVWLMTISIDVNGKQLVFARVGLGRTSGPQTKAYKHVLAHMK